MDMHRLYVYSGTGNTLHGAERIAEALGGGTELINMAGCLGKATVGEGETVGIAYPVHAFGAPLVVHRFLETFSASRESWVYLFLTSGGMPLRAAVQGVRLLAKRGVRVRGAFHQRMPGNYPPVSNPPSGAKLEKIVAEAEQGLAAICDAVRSRRETPPSGGLFAWLSTFANSHAMAKVGPKDRRYRATDACTSCGVCATVCPVRDIALDERGRPRWLGACTGCMACFHWCPAKAIEYSATSASKNRYHHPAISRERYLAWSAAHRSA